MLRLGRAIPRCRLRCRPEWKRPYHMAADEFGYLGEPSSSGWQPRVGEMSPLAAQRLLLINAFRRFGHSRASLDPLKLIEHEDLRELSPSMYGLSESDSLPSGDLTIADLAEQLAALYCGPLATEYMHLASCEERAWFTEHFEKVVTSELGNEEKKKLAMLMMKSENFDEFLTLKFPTVKRYGAEGAEAMFGFFSELFESAPEKEIQQIFIAIAHRGRLNLLTELMEFPVVQMFRKMRGRPEFPSEVDGSGDVLSHLVSSLRYKSPEGSVAISMLPNPSHLEAVNPVALGKTRARARTLGVGDYSRERRARVGDGILCIQVHGDGAFTGQGVVWESIALSQVPHFRVGGSLHLVTNNQVAFTAESNIGRSTTHVTDIAKAFDCPVLHVNGDYPEQVVLATRLALAYRNRFRKDIFINLVCYRRWGHNELDDPSFTNPLMYQAIESRESVPTKYSKHLISNGIMTEGEYKEEKAKHTQHLLEQFRAVDKAEPCVVHLRGNWEGMKQAPAAVECWDTGVDIQQLKWLGAASVKYPDTFEIHPHLKKTHCEPRLAKLTAGEGIDWATAEALAMSSLLSEGVDVRISGQDVGRATFSHRHAMFVDQKTDEAFIPLNHLQPEQQGFLEVANNLLSEEAILGFEYGFSLENPRRLCIWEAQFGDFFNGAQIIIDNFIASGESKWLTQSGLTLLLPHGFDGAGPEHSSCHIERFLQLCNSAEDQCPVDGESVNFRIANPTTSAQYFHLLRRQVIPLYRKPLILVAPKILLRHPRATSSLLEFAPGTSFKNVIVDSSTAPENVEKIIFVSGKHFIAVEKARSERQLDEKVTVVRVESLCPFPVADLKDIIAKFPRASKFVWSQEEPRNAGAWSFIRPRFEKALGIQLRYAGRPELAWTATAIAEHHAREADQVIRDTFDD